MAIYDDVLDHLGKTPREFGSLQVHVEPVRRGPDGDVWVVAWVQAALTPVPPGARLELICAASDQHEGMDVLLDVPTLPHEGAVIRWTFPLATLPAHASAVTVTLRSEIAEEHGRIRTAWMLTDTVEAAHLPDRRQLPELFASGSRNRQLEIQREAEFLKSIQTHRHAARPMPRLEVPVIEGPTGSLHAGVRCVWTPGQRLPPLQATPLPVPAPPAPASEAPRAGLRRHHCGFAGKLADYASDKLCPGCGGDWD